MNVLLLLLVAIETEIVQGLTDNPSEAFVTMLPRPDHKMSDPKNISVEQSYPLVPLANGRAGVRLSSVCNRTSLDCAYGKQLKKTEPNLLDNFEDARGILFLSFDNINNHNLVYSKYGAIVAKINDNVKFEKLSDECNKGLVFKKGYISLPHHNMKQKTMKSMSIVTWIKIDSLEHENTIYACIGDDVMHHLEILKSQGSWSVGAIRWLYRPTRSDTVFSIVTADVVRVGRWTHLAAVYDGYRGTLTIFVNGKDVFSYSGVKEVSKISWDGTFMVGMYPVQHGRVSPFYLEGSMDNFGIYAESLDEELVKQLMDKCDFNAGTEGLALRYNFESMENKKIKDNSDNGYEGIVEGQLELNKWSSLSCQHSMHFKQAKGFIYLEAADGIQAQMSNSMTVAVWVRVDKVLSHPNSH